MPSAVMEDDDRLVMGHVLVGMRRLLSLRASAARAPPEGGTDHVAEAVRLVDERNLGTCTTPSFPSRRRHPLRSVLFFGSPRCM